MLSKILLIPFLCTNNQKCNRSCKAANKKEATNIKESINVKKITNIKESTNVKRAKMKIIQKKKFQVTNPSDIKILYILQVGKNLGGLCKTIRSMREFM